MKPPNPPKRHHYIPQFMLEAWLDEKSKTLKRYTRPLKEVVMRDSVTVATGFEKSLYTLPGVEPIFAQVLESDFFQKIDNQAAKIYHLLRKADVKGLTAVQRNAWTCFVLVMRLRTPRNLEAYKAGFKGKFNERTLLNFAKDDALQSTDCPDMFIDFIKHHYAEIVDYFSMHEFPRIAQSGSFGTNFLNMSWRVFRTDSNDCSFVISDEPLIIEQPLDGPEGYLAFPLAPDAMFFATNDTKLPEVFAKMRTRDVVKKMNKLLVERADCFVGARDLSHDAFIKKHYGKKPSDTIATLFAAQYG